MKKNFTRNKRLCHFQFSTVYMFDSELIHYNQRQSLTTKTLSLLHNISNLDSLLIRLILSLCEDTLVR